MANDLVDPGDIDYLPGSPFTDDEVDAAVAALRATLEWHIAPEREETVTFDISHWQTRLLLPTRELVSVEEVRSDGVIVDAADYEVSIERRQVVKSSGYWKTGFGVIEVDMTHGYASAPLDLLAVVAETATSHRLLAVRAPVIEQPAAVGEGVGADIVSANALTARVLRRDVLDRYSLRWLPGLA